MKRFRWLAAIVVGLLLGGGIAYASIPGPDGVIHACYKTSNPAQGAVIAIDSAASCPSGYTALNWNQTGPPGLAGVHVVRQEYFSSGPGQIVCPIGETALSVVSGDSLEVDFTPSLTTLTAGPSGTGRPIGYEWTQALDPANDFTMDLTCAITN